MKLRKYSRLVLLTIVFGVFLSTHSFAQTPYKLTSCWQPEHSTFVMWNAMEKGWDKEAGLKIDPMYFESGMAQIEVMPAKQWKVGATGSVPMLLGAMRYNAYMIGIANDDTVSVNVLVRPDSDIAKEKGTLKDFPESLGSAESIRGKTILMTTITNSHYALSTWLKRFGLTDADVVIKNMDTGQILAAFESGVGDICVLWAPGSFIGQSKGWVVANQDAQKGHNMVNVLIAEKEFADKNPEKVAAFLKTYMRGIDAIRADGAKLAPAYSKFLLDWAGVELDVDVAAEDIKKHPAYTLKEQLQLFDDSQGQSEINKWMSSMADFFVEQGRFNKDEMDKTLKSGFITDKFLKMASEMQ